MPAAIIFAAAPVSPSPRLASRLNSLENPWVIAADGGAAAALAFGFAPTLLIGDLDSIEQSTLERLRGVPIEPYPRDKNATDGQLAIERALQFQPAEFVLVGFLGGPRLDQELANVMLLTRLTVPTVVLDERNEARLLRAGEHHSWRPEPREVVSLLPILGDASGVRTSGLRWPLQGETLRFGETRGVSNEPVGQAVRVSIDVGVLLITRHFAW